jgi:hypothetical protein
MPAMNRNAALQRRGWQPFGGWDFHANALTSPGADAPAISASSAASKSVCVIRTNPLRNLHGRD